MTKLILAALVALSVQPAQAYDWSSFSLRLRDGMTDQEAISAIGYLPTRVESKTCGTKTKHPWSCRFLMETLGRAVLCISSCNNLTTTILFGS